MSLQLKSGEIVAFFQELKNAYQNPAYESQKKQFGKAMFEEELKFLKTNPPSCKVNEVKRVRQSHYNTNYAKARALLKTHFDDGQVMHLVSCLALSNALIITGEGDIVVADSIHNQLADLKRIGEPSRFGSALRGKLNGYDGFYIIKVAQRNDEDSNNMMYHEIVVGAYMNELRDLGIPNFVYTYGAFRCSPPIYDDSGNVIDWCNGESEEKVPYVLYEDIQDAVTCYAYLGEKKNPRFFFSLMMQIAMCSRVANDKYGYTHYDLHMGNILMRSAKSLGFKGDFYIPYTSSTGKTFYVLTDTIASIIDYGSVYLKGYGTPEWQSELYGRYNDRSLPLADIYKLVCVMAYSFLTRGNFPLASKNLIVYFLQFFTPVKTEQEISAFINDQKKVGFNLPYNTPNKTFVPAGVNVETFIDYLFNVPNNVFPSKMRDSLVTLQPVPGNPILRCRECYSFEQVFLQTSNGGDTSEYPETFEEVYKDALATSENYELPTSFSAQEATQALETNLSSIQMQISENLKVLKPIDLTLKNVYDRQVLLDFRQFYFVVIDLYRLLDEVVRIENMLNWLNDSLYPAQEWDLESALQKTKNLREQLIGPIKAALVSLVLAFSVLEQVLPTDAHRNLSEQFTDYKWYETIYYSLKELTTRKGLYDDEDVIMSESDDKGKEKEKSSTVSSARGATNKNTSRRQSFLSTPTGRVIRRTKLFRSDENL